MSEPLPRALPALLALMLAALLLRAVTLAASGAGLQVDEAQYWDWSRHLQWGYWSKPPGIAAVIAASTAVAGDSVMGIKALCMLMWPMAAAALAWMAWDMAGRGQAGQRAALWSAALLLGTPAAGLLGMAATTDAPLLLMWALCMALSWRALRSTSATSALPWWALAGLSMGLGLLSKYTMAAAGMAWAILMLMHGRRHGAGLVLAGALALAVLAPNLWWNASHDWPTLGHTAEITVAAPTPAGGTALAVAEFLIGQLLLIGPVALVTAGVAWRVSASGRGDARPPAQALRFALMYALPLGAVALLQSFNARANMNWTVPALLGLCLWLGLKISPHLGRRAWWISTLTALLLPSAVSFLGAWPAVQQQALQSPRHFDLWARMRGWEPTLQELKPVLAAQPNLPVVATQRDVLVHARYVWRDLDRTVMAWPPNGKPRHHYEQFEPLWIEGQAPPERLLLLSPTAPDAKQRQTYPYWQALAQAQSGRVQLQLWLGSREPLDR